MTTDAAIISAKHPNAVSYRRAADALRAGDLDTVATTIQRELGEFAAVVHEGVIWHLPGTSWMVQTGHRSVNSAQNDAGNSPSAWLYSPK